MKSSGLAGALLLLCLTNPAVAEPVYSWTDATGVTHFSETPPDDTRVESRVLDIEPAPVTAAPPVDDYYSIANQAARMEARRMEQQRLRAEILRAEAEARRADAAAREQAIEPATEETHYYPVYPWYPFGHRRPPHYREQPRFRPPHQPYPPPTRPRRAVAVPDK